MNDLDFEIMLLDEEFDEIMREIEGKTKKDPEWWLIALGSKDAPKPVYDRACKILKRFKSFCYATGNHNFYDAVGLFEANIAQGRIQI
tara:strand:- start:1304 stop:1567 length:264 start_codon:yes stop_codon:yes gene_type:complete